jgi:hypothetical protein
MNEKRFYREIEWVPIQHHDVFLELTWVYAWCPHWDCPLPVEFCEDKYGNKSWYIVSPKMDAEADFDCQNKLAKADWPTHYAYIPSPNE